MRAARTESPEQILWLTPRRQRSIRLSLRAWLGFQPDTLYAAAFGCPAVDALGLLLQDPDVMADFISQHYRNHRLGRELAARQIRYVTLHWLADIACGLGRY